MPHNVLPLAPCLHQLNDVAVRILEGDDTAQSSVMTPPRNFTPAARRFPTAAARSATRNVRVPPAVTPPGPLGICGTGTPPVQWSPIRTPPTSKLVQLLS